MKTYSGFKVIQAEPAIHDGEEGYKVVYPDGYTSWSPKDAFENAYTHIDSLDFAHALALAKQGKHMYRPGWPEGMNMFHDGKDIMLTNTYEVTKPNVKTNIDNFDISATDWRAMK